MALKHRGYLRCLSAYSYYETGDFEKGKTIMDEYFARVEQEGSDHGIRIHGLLI